MCGRLGRTRRLTGLGEVFGSDCGGSSRGTTDFAIGRYEVHKVFGVFGDVVCESEADVFCMGEVAVYLIGEGVVKAIA